jgi:hypothetical protein
MFSEICEVILKIGEVFPMVALMLMCLGLAGFALTYYLDKDSAGNPRYLHHTELYDPVSKYPAMDVASAHEMLETGSRARVNAAHTKNY